MPITESAPPPQGVKTNKNAKYAKVMKFLSEI